MLRRTLPWRSALAVAIVCAIPAHARAVDRIGLEAAIIYNILQFVDWPGEDSMAAGTALIVCLDSGSPLLHELESLDGRPVRKLKLSVKGIGSHDLAPTCNGLYVDSDVARKVGASSAAVPTSHLLTIGGSAYAHGERTVISLSEMDGRIVFDVDMKEARSAGLVVSSRLLRLARRVGE
jgi:hypothetical protein